MASIPNSRPGGQATDPEATPGPWRTDEQSRPVFGGDGAVRWVDVRGEDDAFVCRLDYPYLDPAGRARVEANARLIAAAPDLLAACLGARQWLYGNEEVKGLDVLVRLEKAIAKATGADR